MMGSMGGGGIILIIAGVIALVVVSAYFSYLAAKKRREALAALAQQLGWRFSPDRDSSHDSRYSHFEIFRRGHSRYAYNILEGAIDVDGASCYAQMGDFHYKVTSGSGKHRRTSTYRFSYLIMHLPWMTQALVIRPEGFFDKVAGFFGFDDIDFESEEFSRRFCVKSPDKRFAYDVIDARMMEYLLAGRPRMIDIESGRLCLSDGSGRWDPAEFGSAVECVKTFMANWPEHVKTGLRSAAAR